jgi:hypothetical protein
VYETQAQCNLLSGTLHQNVLSIGTGVDGSAKLVATGLNDMMGKRDYLSPRDWTRDLA